MKKLSKCNNEYTARNLLDYLYHQNYYKLIGINLFKTSKYDYSTKNKFHRKIRRRTMLQQSFLSLKNSKKKLFETFI